MSSEETLMDFKQAIQYMDPMQVTDYLQKILDFLKRNNDEICFPNISPYVEAFLVNLVTDTRNLKYKSFSEENKRLASEIIEVLEVSKDVFRWLYTYGSGKVTKNLLVYKKIYSNKIKKKASKPSTIAHRLIQAQSNDPQAKAVLPTQKPQNPNPTIKSKPANPSNNSKPVNPANKSQPQNPANKSQPQNPTNKSKPENPANETLPLITTGFKLHILNKTLRFIKNEAETVLVYDEMASHQAEYINSLFNRHDNDIGFGYKSLYAPLWEAMEVHGVKYMFKMSLKETGTKMAVLTLEKKPRTYTQGVKNSKDVGQENATSSVGRTNKENVSKNVGSEKKDTKQGSDQSLDSSVCSVSSTQSSSNSSKLMNSKTASARPETALLNNISDQFFQDTVTALTEFAEDSTRASITFDQLTDDEMRFVKKVKTIAASKESRSVFMPRFRNLLVNLNFNIQAAVKTCKITTTVNEKERGITLKKAPLFGAPANLHSTSGARSKSVALTKLRERSLSGDRMIQFEKASKTIKGSAETAKEKDIDTDKESTEPTESAERGRTKERTINKRTAKLLEDMSTPLESDRGIRMMLLMGWKGGALGARGEGIMEPIIPPMDMPTKAGLGHVPPPKAAPTPTPTPAQPRRPIDFRMMLLHNILDLLLHDDTTKKVSQYKEPLVKKETTFLKTAVKSLNLRRALGLTDKENELVQLSLRVLLINPRVMLSSELSQDLRTVTLTKFVNLPMPLRAIKSQVLKAEAKALPPTPRPIPIAAVTIATEVLVTNKDIEMLVPYVEIKKTALAPKTIRLRASRLVFMMKIADVLRGDYNQIVFKSVDHSMHKNLKLHLRNMIESVNARVWHDKLFKQEYDIYMDIQNCASKDVLSIEIKSAQQFVLRKAPLFMQAVPNHVGDLKAINNNNNEKVDNQNKVQTNDVNGQIEVDSSKEQKDSSEELRNSSKGLKDSSKELKDSPKEKKDCPKELKDSSKELKDITKTNHETNVTSSKSFKTVESDLIKRKINEGNHSMNKPIKNANLNAFDVDTQADSSNFIIYAEKDKMDDSQRYFNIVDDSVQVTINNDYDTDVVNDKESDVLTSWEQMELSDSEDNSSEAKTVVDVDSDPLDLDRDIQDLEMAIMEADLKCNIKKEIDPNDNDNNAQEILKTDIDSIKKEIISETETELEMSISEAELSFKIKKEKDVDSSPKQKRSRTNSICSQELHPKRTKIGTDEHVVIISPKNCDEKITEDIARQVQSLITIELDKSDGFLPLLNCYGIENGGLIYGCHDDDNVAWLKKVIVAANLNLEVSSCGDLCLDDKKSRKLVIKINSFIPLDTQKTFKNFEAHNPGLSTKYWKVLSKHTNDNCVLFIVEVDEKSLKYISDESFSLHCGIDKAQFSIIF